MAWDSIKPVSFVFLWMEQEDVKLWMKKVLRPEIIENLTIYGRLPRAQALEIVREARILLAPSLMDGIPNSMLEAMTLGAIPIVSPLKSIRTFVTDENVIFARNLFPEEIASALKEGLEDSDKNRLRISKNFELIKENYDRCKISSRVVQFYNEC
jgi:glycosyltransferase involved in cell wall biosynthesis